MNQQSQASAEEFEQLGDEALSAGQSEQALQHYEAAHALLCEALDLVLGDDADFEVTTMIADDLTRLDAKAHDVWSRLQPSPTSLDDQVAQLRSVADASLENGHAAHAAQVYIELAKTLEQLDDRDGAESAYRQAVALARQVDAAMPELMLVAFACLIHFLSPSEESVTLAQEMAVNLIDRDEMYHPMRAAEAAHHCAIAELQFAAIHPHRMDHAVVAVALPTITLLEDICFHDRTQALQRLIADVLRTAGRDVDADQWQAEADTYEDWEMFMEQQIPGHVHLWDIRFSLSDPVGQDE